MRRRQAFAGSNVVETVEQILGDLIERLKAAGPLDGLYIDLHGAMVCEHLNDGEGEILARLRAAPSRTQHWRCAVARHRPHCWFW